MKYQALRPGFFSMGGCVEGSRSGWGWWLVGGWVCGWWWDGWVVVGLVVRVGVVGWVVRGGGGWGGGGGCGEWVVG